ncbi:DUF3021 family protein [Bacillus sp. S/N-304-OC-R1]|uniref:DUF3021 family protein n=1 Tax=Bacillus sp. S/N-304-OC-R1 TaxID=2758034 RepID=UPI001C8DC853|nr:DUF3021 family protein [Bacillus sp. S/N-304-OC-R1]MBY0123577.1 DUF3021 family protein [Bacillus sp. S/N-304-OC-R1]
MNLTEFVQKTMKNFLIIFASIIIIMTVLRQMYYPDLPFDLKSIYIIMAFAFLGALTGFILYSPHDETKKKMRIKMAIHFFTLEILLISLGSIFGIVNNALEASILTLQIAVIYFLVRLLSWQKDKKEAQIINEKLKALKKDA